MSEIPEEIPSQPQDATLPEETSAGEGLTTRETVPETAETSAVLVVPIADPAPQNDDDAPLLFQSFTRLIAPPQERIPHMGHIGILMLLALGCLAVAALLARAAVSYHFFGVTTLTEAATEIHYTLGTEAVFYLLTLCCSVLLFPLLWHRSFFAALQWHAEHARRYAGYLLGAAGVCFVLAMFDGMFLPGPADAPIDRIFRTPGAAWILFAFGVTLAPFFEELAFRGFLLPALSTAFDWIAEKVTGEPPHPLDEYGHPQWSMPAMVVASVIASLLFAALHADQTGYSLGPFLLLVLVSLVLCAVRLALRSLAASVLVHATYNFLLFSFMFFGTSGFRHLENM
jgi:membrane protease YdiL (CAAX protease family)